MAKRIFLVVLLTVLVLLADSRRPPR
jgi:hypothetical protein